MKRSTAAGEGDGFVFWQDDRELPDGSRVGIRFVGKGPPRAVPEVVRHFAPGVAQPVWLRQVHGREVIDARCGRTEAGDALVTASVDLALAVVTADCVPVLLAGRGRIGAVHAGWRGIVAGVVPAAMARFAVDRGPMLAWIGPAIGPCCYEVDADVAAQVAAASGPEVIAAGPGGKPHLDLAAAVALQLRATGLDDMDVIPACTRCDPSLWSYRRARAEAVACTQADSARVSHDSRGRNVAMIWRLTS